MYEIRKQVSKRRRTRFIILTQIKNTYDPSMPIKPMAKIGSSKSYWNVWQNYYYSLFKWKVPIHYYTEQIGNDYSIFVGCPSFAISYFLEDLVKFRIIAPQYIDSILVGIGEDFTLELPDKRLWKQLSYRLINPLIIEYNDIKDIFAIKYIDEIINWDNYYKALSSGDIKYQIFPSKYFNKEDFLSALRVHYNKVRSV